VVIFVSFVFFVPERSAVGRRAALAAASADGATLRHKDHEDHKDHDSIGSVRSWRQPIVNLVWCSV
jgi:hypothetical protein